LAAPAGFIAARFNQSLRDSITPPLRSPLTRWFPGGHSVYFAPPRLSTAPSEQIYQDVENVEALKT